MQLEALESWSYRRAFSVTGVLIAGILVAFWVFAPATLTVASYSAAAERRGLAVQIVVGLSVATVGIGLWRTLPSRLRKYQMQGILEAVLATGTPMGVLPLAFAVVGVASSLAGTSLVLALAVAARAVADPGALALAAMVGLAALPSCLGLGLISMGVTFAVKQGDPISALGAVLSLLLSGAIVPLDMVPPTVAKLAFVLPLTHAVRGAQSAMTGGGTADAQENLIALAMLGPLLVATGICVFRWGVARATRDGSLSHY